MSHDELRAAHERLKAELAELLEAHPLQETENPDLRLLLEKLQALTEQYDHKVTELEAELAELKRQMFGPKADRLTPEQEEHWNQLNRDLQEQAGRPGPVSNEVLEHEDRAARRRRGRGRGRHPLPEHLETETITIEPEVKICSCCGKPLEKIGEEITEEIDRIPAKLIRRRTVRPKLACRCGEGGVHIAPLPPRLIPQSRLGLGLGVHIVLSRFDDHLSYYRLEQQFRERHGIVIPRQQMVQWVQPIASLLRPVCDAMWQRMLAGGYLQVDETPVRVLDPEVEGKAARGYLWFYAVPGGDVILDFSRSRGLDPVRERLKNFAGTIQTDAYEVYQALERKEARISRIGCLAHSRRRFYAALKENLPEAVWFIDQIRSLYRIEDEVRESSAAERLAFRLQNTPAIWQAMKARAEALKPRLLPQSTMGKAVSYFLDEYDALQGYLREGRYEIDNNLVENDIRPTAVGRRRWLFIGHPDAGWRSAVIYSILVSCRRRGVNPQDYLTDVLRRLPGHKINKIEELLPGNWKPTCSDTS
jgi:transposase